MSGIMVRSRLLMNLMKNKRPRKFSSSSYHENFRVTESHFRNDNPHIKDQQLQQDYNRFQDHPRTSSSSAPFQPPGAFKANKGVLRSILGYGLFAAFLGTVGAAGYAGIRYTVYEVDERTMAFRNSANQIVDLGDDASITEEADNSSVRLAEIDDFHDKVELKALLYSTSMTVSAKCLETYLELRKSIEARYREYYYSSTNKYLPDLHPTMKAQGVFTLVLDLDETLVYSDYNSERGWRTFKRPGVDAFLEKLAMYYEIVVYSDQLEPYVNPVTERLDRKGCILYKLGRSATRYQDGKHYRDLSKLNRDPSRILYVSGHALESALQPENCVQIKPWKLEEGDTELVDLLPFLEFVGLRRQEDTRAILASYKGFDIASEFNKHQSKR
ncbi:hypothetical protein IFM89_011186 [Coptis chinensis]|uniref:Mitochondrial import inner membrane translocase subunit TIM50 n=1 Tax=Coptis chinensis TaxID=261450 RepID=A0A835HT71_9MAGN|nr:hypothetical protein IFM89_011186 [Coptis chinensis]